MGELSAARRAEIDQAFADALDLPNDERARLLADLRGYDTELAAAVESLLYHAEHPDSHLDPARLAAGPLWDELTADLDAEDQPVAGERIGPYRILHEIGRGGMAVVYLAERADGAFEQQVALKILRTGMAGQHAMRRFQQERQILAMLNHPNIARFLDGGVDQRGRPYIVLEHVPGMPLDRYCDSHQLGIDERIGLLLVVARALLAAHRNLIVHRDLKPQNILVTAGGEVRLLDFGIAKLLDPTVAGPHAAPPTRTLARILTPEYASPEQVRGLPITTASDVYQLGILLYELLSGQRPYRVSVGSLAEAERVICDEEPKRPSAVVLSGRRPTTAEEETARNRASTPAALARRLRGDLDMIVMMALRKEPERRYPSPEPLIADLERYRTGLPVSAQSDTLRYRTRKFIGRHRLGVTVAVAMFAILLGYAVTVTVQARRITREAARTARVKDFLTGLLGVPNPGVSKGRVATARELLDEGAERIFAELAGEPEIQAEMLTQLGKVYNTMGLYDEAIPLLDQALALRRRFLGRRHLETSTTAWWLARNFHFMGRYAEAEPLYREVVAVRRERLGAQNALTLEAVQKLGALLHSRGDFVGADESLRQVVMAHRRVYPPGDFALASPLADFADLLRDRGALVEAEPLYRSSADILRRHLGEDDPQLAWTRNGLGHLLRLAGRHAEAEPILVETLNLRRRLHAEGHPALAESLQNLALLRIEQKRLGEAAMLLDEAYAMNQRFLGKEHPWVSRTENHVAELALVQGATERAERYGSSSFDRLRRNGLGRHPLAAEARLILARVRLEQRRFSEAEPLLAAALAIERAQFIAAEPRIAATEKMLAGCRQELRPPISAPGPRSREPSSF